MSDQRREEGGLTRLSFLKASAAAAAGTGSRPSGPDWGTGQAARIAWSVESLDFRLRALPALLHSEGPTSGPHEEAADRFASSWLWARGLSLCARSLRSPWRR